jgi:cytochrome b involved in lipid metabolism
MRVYINYGGRNVMPNTPTHNSKANRDGLADMLAATNKNKPVFNSTADRDALADMLAASPTSLLQELQKKEVGKYYIESKDTKTKAIFEKKNNDSFQVTINGESYEGSFHVPSGIAELAFLEIKSDKFNFHVATSEDIIESHKGGSIIRTQYKVTYTL